MNRRALAAGAALVAVAAAAWLTSPALLVDRLTWLAADPLRLAAALGLLAVVRPFLAWPTTLLAVVAGYGFGLAGAPLALGLITLTSVPPYWFARRGRDGWGGGRLSALTTRAAGAGERAVSVAGGARSVAAVRLVPVPSDVVNVGAGLAGVRLLPFLAGTAVGEVPWAVAGTVAGASAGRVAGGGWRPRSTRGWSRRRRSPDSCCWSVRSTATTRRRRSRPRRRPSADPAPARPVGSLLRAGSPFPTPVGRPRHEQRVAVVVEAGAAARLAEPLAPVERQRGRVVGRDQQRHPAVGGRERAAEQPAGAPLAAAVGVDDQFRDVNVVAVDRKEVADGVAGVRLAHEDATGPESVREQVGTRLAEVRL
ncbi:hypothetical protein K933_08297 [Candidatus Halobonum tyrrellensis G22]|uniref:VTT domain-containing protein n=1 Tax=Candidatus Halobonum tyrrellensis G22 TaxID=1324957 RepID=V4HCM2_9EURY|nr:hypothetical protein K933_08297 [Candidatus Halobonum tyrrellensis G22]